MVVAGLRVELTSLFCGLLVRSGGFGPCASRYFSLFSGTQSFRVESEKSEQKVHALLVL